MNLKKIKFYYYNIKNKINYKLLDTTHITKLNICLLLAAGTSSRFNSNICKQLFEVNDKPVILHTVDKLINIVDYIIIITNSKNYIKIKELIDKSNVIIIVNDINDRNESIKVGIEYINCNFKVNNIIIHDVARPYIPEEYFIDLLKSNETYMYTQYYLKLVNGLVRKKKDEYKVYHRDEFIEICTPLCCNFNLYYFLFNNYVHRKEPFCVEIIDILNILNIKYNFLEGKYNQLKKITYIDDIN